MIEAVETEIPQARRDEIHLWMNRAEAIAFENAIKAEIATLTADSCRIGLKDPYRMINSPQSLPVEMERKMRAAARLQIALDVFREKKDGKFVSVNLKLI